ncbi:MAG: rRNA pseudouridine synthase [Ruminococcaceae bacterium]|nr:rRNA pseudouridine synthase [Oscillospiraceae bacterium]
MQERLQKILSAAGICSRRAAENYILSGRVTVNGMIAVLGQQADPETDDIRVDDTPVSIGEERVYLLLNKPCGYVTTLSDEKGRPTAADLVADCGIRVYPVGRLDLNSEGLLLMTNDGALMQRLLHPAGEVNKTYHVWVSGAVDGAAERLSAITDLEGEVIRPAEVTVLEQRKHKATLSIVIHEGKNRQIRRMCAACALRVERLRRVAEHTLTLGDLPVGTWRYLTEAEVDALKNI